MPDTNRPRRARLRRDSDGPGELSVEQWAAWRAMDLALRRTRYAIDLGLKAHFGLLASEYDVLCALGRTKAVREAQLLQDTGMRRTDLAEVCCVTNAAITYISARLVEAGMAEKLRSPLNDSVRLLKLTPAGIDLLDRADWYVACLVRAYVVDRIPDADLDATRRAMTGLVAVWDLEIDPTLPAPARYSVRPPFPTVAPQVALEE